MNCLKILSELMRLKRNEKKTVGEITALQQKMLKRLLHYAYEQFGLLPKQL